MRLVQRLNGKGVLRLADECRHLSNLGDTFHAHPPAVADERIDSLIDTQANFQTALRQIQAISGHDLLVIRLKEERVGLLIVDIPRHDGRRVGEVGCAVSEEKIALVVVLLDALDLGHLLGNGCNKKVRKINLTVNIFYCFHQCSH